jgi:hypothetical protein
LENLPESSYLRVCYLDGVSCSVVLSCRSDLHCIVKLREISAAAITTIWLRFAHLVESLRDSLHDSIEMSAQQRKAVRVEQ